MSDAFKVVRDFESALCEYAGAPFAVTTTSCTDALKLAVAWHSRNDGAGGSPYAPEVKRPRILRTPIEIPKRTYVGVPMAIIHAGGRPTFRDEDWVGAYQLNPLPVWDSARWLTEEMYKKADKWFPGTHPMLCLSFHWAKTLGIQQGGAILHDDPEADRWLRMARFDGRMEGMAPKDQKQWIIGHHCYMAPETAAAGLVRLRNLPRHNEPLPNDNYPDLSTMEIFK